MEHVAGRVADFLIKEDGTRVAGISLIENTLTHFPGLDQMQIVQDESGELHLNIVSGREYIGTIDSEMIAYFKKVFPGTKIGLHYVENIPQEPSGKYRFSICNI